MRVCSKIVTATTSVGTGETSIPNRLKRGEIADIVIVADPGTPCPYFSAFYRCNRTGRHRPAGLAGQDEGADAERANLELALRGSRNTFMVRAEHVDRLAVADDFDPVNEQVALVGRPRGHAVVPQHMAETVARRGGITILPQDISLAARILAPL